MKSHHLQILLCFLISSLTSPTAQTPGTLHGPAQKADSLKSAIKIDSSASAQSDTSLFPDSVFSDSTSKVAAKKKSGPADTLDYEALVIFYDLPNKILHLRGKAYAQYQNITLYADTIIYRIDQSLFEAIGNPRLIDGADTTVGEYMTYNIKTKRGRVKYATTRMAGSFFDGQQIVKSEDNHLYINEGDYTTCAYLEHPHFYFYAKNIKVIPKDKTISRPVVLNIGEVPVAALPYFIQPLDKGRRSGWLTPLWGGHPMSGGYLDNVGYYWAPNDYIDLKTALKIQEFENYVFNAASNYALRYWFSGGINARYSLGTNYTAQTQNWALDYSHNQNLLPDGSFTLAGRGNLVGNRTFYNRFSEDTSELINQQISANMALSKRFSAINASAQAAWSRNHNLQTEKITEDIPSVSFSLPSRPIIPFKTPEDAAGDAEKKEPAWYNNIYFNYATRGIVKREAYANDSFKQQIRPGITQSIGLSAPQKVLKYFTFDPSFNAQVSNFYGYIDTAISSYDTVQDTIRYSLASSSIDTFYKTYTLAGIDTTRVLDSTDIYDTLYDTTFTFTKVGKPRSVARYDTTLNDWKSDYSWNAGARLSTTLYGLFPVKIGSFAGMRHTITPSISYSFTPAHDQSKNFFPIGIPYQRGSKKQSQVMGVGIDNLFQGKIVKEPKKPGDPPVESKFTILTLGMSTGYNFEKEDRKWSDLSVSAGTAFSVVRVNFGSSYWLYDENGEQSFPILHGYSLSLSPNNFSASGTFWDGDLLVLKNLNPNDPVEYGRAGPQQWRINLSPSYSFSATRATPKDVFVPEKHYSLGASASLDFTRNWSMSWSSSYDFQKNAFVGHSFNFRCDLECWDLRFDWRPSGINPGYYFIVNIKQIPEIKWELRQ